MPSASPVPASVRPHTPRPRDPWVDNAKAVLVVLVVVGHFIPLLPRNDAAGHVYDFLYLWHMPAFVLVSGWMSRRASWSRQHLTQLVTLFVVPYLVLSTLMGWVRVDVAEEVPDLEALQPWWLEPSWPFWYLVAMVVWRLATPVLRAHWLWLPVAVGASLVSGQWDLPWLDLNRILGFLPFFVLGLHLPRWHEAAMRRREAVPVALSVMAGLWWLAGDLDRWFGTEWLYYRSSYAEMGVETGDGTVLRLALLAVGLAGASAALALVPRGRHAYTAMGAWTMVVYLLHGFVKQLATALDAARWLPDGEWAQVGWVVAGGVAVGVLLGWPPVARRLEWLVDPVATVRFLSTRMRTVRTAPSPAPRTRAAPSADSCPSELPRRGSARPHRGGRDTRERAHRAPDGGARQSAGPRASR